MITFLVLFFHEKIRNNPNLSEQEKQAKIKENDIRLKDKLDADSERMKSVDKRARKAINKEIAVGAAKNVAKEIWKGEQAAWQI